MIYPMATLIFKLTRAIDAAQDPSPADTSFARDLLQTFACMVTSAPAKASAISSDE
jgi:hypothetical protein